MVHFDTSTFTLRGWSARTMRGLWERGGTGSRLSLPTTCAGPAGDNIMACQAAGKRVKDRGSVPRPGEQPTHWVRAAPRHRGPAAPHHRFTHTDGHLAPGTVTAARACCARGRGPARVLEYYFITTLVPGNVPGTPRGFMHYSWRPCIWPPAPSQRPSARSTRALLPHRPGRAHARRQAVHARRQSSHA